MICRPLVKGCGLTFLFLILSNFTELLDTVDHKLHFLEFVFFFLFFSPHRAPTKLHSKTSFANSDQGHYMSRDQE